MQDPRIEELMDYIDAVDENGELTSIARIARRVSSYLEIVDELRSDLDEQHGAVEELEVRGGNLTDSLQQRDLLRDELTELAQTAAVKAAVTTVSSGRSVQLRNEAAEKQKELKQFEADYDEDEQTVSGPMACTCKAPLPVMI